MSIEQQITKGYASYLRALGYDAHRSHLILLCLTNPSETRIARTVIFRGVTHYHDTRHTNELLDDADLESLIGVDAASTGTHTRYVICTEYREISFETHLLPEIIEHKSSTL